MNRIFQSVVNLSQRWPHWWGRQCNYLCGMGLAGCVINGSEFSTAKVIYVIAFAGIVVSTHILTRNQAAFTLLLSPIWFTALRRCGALLALATLYVEPNTENAFNALAFVAALCVDEFARCAPPAAPKTRHRLAPAL